MCGIVGSLGSGSRELTTKMTQCIHHRGPDDDGFLIDEKHNVFFGMRRLAIIDVGGGKQPIYNRDQTIGVVFNGEIYNYQLLRQELESKGYIFKTSTDTEVIVHGYEAYGTDIFGRLNGMFAIALWDARNQRAVLVRDRLGQKPLYYTAINHTLYFASELKVFNVLPGFSKEIDHTAFMKFIDQTYCGGQQSIFKNVKKIPAGSFLIYEGGNHSMRQYWKLPELSPGLMNFEESKSVLDELISDAVNIRLMSDVPLGVFLSGGLDSSLVAYYAQKHSVQKIHTYTVKFAEGSFDESPHARKVAEFLGTNHTEELVSPEQTLSIINELGAYMDEPQADTSFIPTYWLAKMTRKYVTVALGGDAGDELFFGYQTFKAWQQWKLLCMQPAFVRKIARQAVAQLPSSSSYFSFDFKMKRALNNFAPDYYNQHFRWFSPFAEEELQNLFTRELRHSVTSMLDYRTSWPGTVYDTAINQSAHLYQKYYLTDDILTKVDRATMATSLEGRGPFLDYRIIEFANQLPSDYKFKNGEGKFILKRIAEQYLPHEIVNRTKHGFPAPVDGWLRGSLKKQIEELFTPASINRLGLLDAPYVSFLWKDFIDGNHYRARQIWTLFIWQLWSEQNI